MGRASGGRRGGANMDPPHIQPPRNRNYRTGQGTTVWLDMFLARELSATQPSLKNHGME